MRTVGVSTRIRVRQVYVMRLKLVRGERIRVCQVYVMRTKFKPNSVLTPNPQQHASCAPVCVCVHSRYCIVCANSKCACVCIIIVLVYVCVR